MSDQFPVEPLPVEAKEKCLCAGAHCPGSGQCMLCAEPKPTPSSSAPDEDLIALKERVWQAYLSNEGGMRLNVDKLKPQPDSSSIPEIELELRRMMWLGHGHTGMYGDDGEMQCMECRPFGVVDYKREPLDKVRDTFRAVQMERMMKPRDSCSIGTEQTFGDWWKVFNKSDFAKAFLGIGTEKAPYGSSEYFTLKRCAKSTWATAKGQR